MMDKPIGYRQGSEYASLHDAAVTLVNTVCPKYSGDLPAALLAMAKVISQPSNSSVLKYCMALALTKVSNLGKY